MSNTCNTLRCALILICLISTLTHAYMFLHRQKYGRGPCIDNSGNIRQINDVWYDDNLCEEYTCFRNRGIPYIQVFGCGAVGVRPGCRLERGKGSYPHCCKDEVC
uniref:Venom protein n=1 Tax=Hadrurus spadix TaxID=141984 RepID=A0A1W7R970_9SCOR